MNRRVEKTCEHCGQAFSVPLSRATLRQMCSRRCKAGGSLLERFETKYCPEPMSGCWLWTASLNHNGYGRLVARGLRGREGSLLKGLSQAHRVSYELHIGRVPRGLCVLHRCDTPACVNPDHLFLGTMADNCADRDAKGRRLAPRGAAHPMAKLTESVVRTIRRSSAPAAELARQLDVNPTTIASARKGLTWTEVR